jgi:hypothetical protein
LVLLVGLVGGIITGVMLGAVGGKLLPLMPMVVVGILVMLVVPSILVARASKALRARKMPVGVRRTVQLLLLLLPQLMVGFLCAPALGEGEASVSGEWARAAHSVLGGVPVLGGVLKDTAARGGAPVDAATTPTTPTGPNTPPVLPSKKLDGGPAPLDAGPTPDAGVLVPTVKSVGGMTPRTGGRSVGNLLAPVQTDDGGLVLWMASVAFGGAVTTRVVDCSMHAAAGAPTDVHMHEDGSAALILGGGKLFTVVPLAQTCGATALLERGQRIATTTTPPTELEVQNIREVAVGVAGSLLVVVDTIDGKRGKPVQALLWRAGADAPLQVLRKGLDPLVDAPPPAPKAKRVLALGYDLKGRDFSGNVVVEEEFAADGEAVAPRLGGLAYDMNPRRLVAGLVDQAKTLTEVARTGITGTGLNGCSLQGFADAARMPDGRVWFDGNCAEAGAKGWLFSSRGGGSVLALVPELQGKDQAPWTEVAPRLMHMSIEQEGALAFVTRDHNVILSSTQRPTEKSLVMLRAEVWGNAGAGGQKVGAVSLVQAATVLRGGDWLAAAVEMLSEGGKRPRAWVLASRDDAAAQKVELLLSEGGPIVVPPVAGVEGGAATTKMVKRLYWPDHDEPLWHGVLDGAQAPAPAPVPAPTGATP